LLADPHYPRLKEHVIATTGLAYYRDRDDDLCQYAGQRMDELSLPGCASYLELLCDDAAGPAELDKLVEQLTIGETFFFRHCESFDALRDTVLPDVIERNRGMRRLRIWSAGCSFGAEPYSLSILLRRDLAHLVAGWDITILATDINREFLNRARRGCFEEWAFRGVSEELKRDAFSCHGGGWCIHPRFRDGITFQYHNLVEHPFPSLLQNLFAFDIILCRNVMIYFSKEVTQRVVAHLHDALVDGGWLLVGHAEPNVEMFQAFRTVTADGAVLYQKRDENRGRQAPDRHANVAVSASRHLPPAAFVEHSDSATHRLQQLHTLRAATLPGCRLATSATATAAAPTARHVAELATLRVLADSGQLDEAHVCCQRILAADKLDPAAHFYHGLILEQLGEHDRAEQALRRAVYLDRSYVLAHYYLGLTAQKRGRSDIARRSFRNVLVLLAELPPEQPIVGADELRVSDLDKLARVHLATVEQAGAVKTPRRAAR
jgi:chemotaxis protein methyltransferase CheR